MKNHPFYGAIVGDIVGSRFEFKPIKTKSFDLFDGACQFTDDTVMTVAISNALLDARATGRPLGAAAVDAMRNLADRIDEQGFDVGYGCRFQQWVFAETPQPPYHSYGNGSAMRVGAVGLWAATAEETIDQARAVTVVSHDHPEGIKGAVATALGVWFAGQDWTKERMRVRLGELYPELLAADYTLERIRPDYAFDETCQRTVPQALAAFFESTSYEDAIRNAISLGGDADTLGAIAGAVAGAFYGVPEAFVVRARTFLAQDLLDGIDRFEAAIASA